MSKDLTDSKLITSDESNSTEHEAIVSLSGTDELNDTHSVFSDIVSTTSKHSKLNDAKKLLHKMNKMKGENLLLKDALEKANASDITMLKTRLRGVNADLVRVRQNNSELKDRIQILEGRLFNALSSQTSKISSSKTDHEGEPSSTLPVNVVSVPERATSPIQYDSKFTSSERANLMDMIRSLQSRNKHLARLVQSYETKINAMQAEVDRNISDNSNNYKNNSNETQHHNSIKFSVAEDNKNDAMGSDAVVAVDASTVLLKSALKGGATISTATNSKPSGTRRRVQVDPSEVEAQLRQAREGDNRMIQELSAEVRRLAALLPRDRIATAESADHISSDKEEVGTGVLEDDAVLGVERVSSVAGEEDSEQAGRADSAASGERVTVAVKPQQRYSPSHLLCSFFLGVMVMLACIAFTTYTSSAVTLPDTSSSSSGEAVDSGSSFDPLEELL